MKTGASADRVLLLVVAAMATPLVVLLLFLLLPATLLPLYLLPLPLLPLLLDLLMLFDLLSITVRRISRVKILVFFAESLVVLFRSLESLVVRGFCGCCLRESCRPLLLGESCRPLLAVIDCWWEDSCLLAVVLARFP